LFEILLILIYLDNIIEFILIFFFLFDLIYFILTLSLISFFLDISTMKEEAYKHADEQPQELLKTFN